MGFFYSPRGEKRFLPPQVSLLAQASLSLYRTRGETCRLTTPPGRAAHGGRSTGSSPEVPAPPRPDQRSKAPRQTGSEALPAPPRCLPGLVVRTGGASGSRSWRAAPARRSPSLSQSVGWRGDGRPFPAALRDRLLPRRLAKARQVGEAAGVQEGSGATSSLSLSR